VAVPGRKLDVAGILLSAASRVGFRFDHDCLRGPLRVRPHMGEA
jgi:hypothetical protein